MDEKELSVAELVRKVEALEKQNKELALQQAASNLSSLMWLVAIGLVGFGLLIRYL